MLRLAFPLTRDVSFVSWPPRPPGHDARAPDTSYQPRRDTCKAIHLTDVRRPSSAYKTEHLHGFIYDLNRTVRRETAEN
ncbi:hypothetical protein GWI33_001010 [Rhynchophorus ferrugineus]|uniref:Uncharacterized protein n=1 Tax=Rhynchophorus ferrugineus TaxID=354439 RepID=A0A834IQQ2_RHYFE|nr:hypothetical protein GWI33_001010 [Rhynchophorus ferrugineus]